MKIRNSKGFTLIELLVVILILAILAALIVPRVIGRTTDAKRAKAASDIKTLKTALNNFRLDCDRYPETEEGLAALTTAPADTNGWRGPYIERISPDPWQNEYIYELVGDDQVSIISYGKDGTLGGEGESADVGVEEAPAQ
jgi:general secretion pathway protein G